MPSLDPSRGVTGTSIPYPGDRVYVRLYIIRGELVGRYGGALPHKKLPVRLQLRENRAGAGAETDGGRGPEVAINITTGELHNFRDPRARELGGWLQRSCYNRFSFVYC